MGKSHTKRCSNKVPLRAQGLQNLSASSLPFVQQNDSQGYILDNLSNAYKQSEDNIAWTYGFPIRKTIGHQLLMAQ